MIEELDVIEEVKPQTLSLPDMRRKYEATFRLIFGVPLSQYWDDNRGGFQITPFMTQVLEYEGPHLYRAIDEEYGTVGIRTIKQIMLECAVGWCTVPF
jgi:hypothetical protein